jgi:ABC-2 type transport system permease protein
MVGCALVLTDWQPHNGVAQTVAGFALLMLFGFAVMWVGTHRPVRVESDSR